MENKQSDPMQGIQGLVYREDLIFEQSAAGRVGLFPAGGRGAGGPCRHGHPDPSVAG